MRRISRRRSLKSFFRSSALVAALAGVAACSGQGTPLVEVLITAPAAGSEVQVAACKMGESAMSCSGQFVAVLKNTDTYNQGAVFDLPAGVKIFPMVMFRRASSDNTIQGACKQFLVTTVDTPPLKINVTSGPMLTFTCDPANCTTPMDCSVP